jgi:protein-S-isoprenylcysteine O-methyltransferase Ste14
MNIKKVVAALVFNVLIIGLPLAGRPHLILHYKVLLVMAGAMGIWLTQPVIESGETEKNKEKDKLSVILILVMSLVSAITPVVHFGYFMQNQDNATLSFYIGVLVMASGVLLRAWAVRKLSRFFTATVQIVEGHELVTGGPYRLVRHPSYSGAALALCGSALTLGSLPGVITAIVCMGAAYSIRISAEEKVLTDYFGDRYIQYRKRSKKLIPFIW